MIHIQNRPFNHKEYKKPIFCCPFHKNQSNNTYYPFKDINIFPCEIERCFCLNTGWYSNCETCGRVIHNCMHGCELGICIKHRLNKEKIIKDDNPLLEHYMLSHPNQKIILEFEGDSVTLPEQYIKQYSTHYQTLFSSSHKTSRAETIYR